MTEVEVPPTAPAAPPSQPTEYNIGADFTNFEQKISGATENEKSAFQDKLNAKINHKQVLIRASKGYGQPEKDYTINVHGVSVDFYYERYVVVLKDEKEKEYFLKPMYKIKILGAAIDKPKSKNKKPPMPVTPLPKLQSNIPAPAVSPQPQR